MFYIVFEYLNKLSSFCFSLFLSLSLSLSEYLNELCCYYFSSLSLPLLSSLKTFLGLDYLETPHTEIISFIIEQPNNMVNKTVIDERTYEKLNFPNFLDKN